MTAPPESTGPPAVEPDRALRDAALAAREQAYAPYSRFRVGAALLCDDGTMVRGCNVENASYPAGLCAERVALGAAVASGRRRFVAIAIATDGGDPAPPCGICRQVLAEFAPDLRVLSITAAGASREWQMRELLPAPFTPAWLEPSA